MHKKTGQVEQPYKYITNEQHRRGVVDDLLWEWKLGVTANVNSNGSWSFLVDPLVYIVQLKKRGEQGLLIKDYTLVSCRVEGKQYNIHWCYSSMTRQEVEKAFALIMEILNEIDRKLLEKANAGTD